MQGASLCFGALFFFFTPKFLENVFVQVHPYASYEQLRQQINLTYCLYTEGRKYVTESISLFSDM